MARLITTDTFHTHVKVLLSLPQELVSRKLQLAQLAESETTPSHLKRTHTHACPHQTHKPQELVSRKLQLAQLAESEMIARRELYKAKESGLKLASKLTKMEAAVYAKR